MQCIAIQVENFEVKTTAVRRNVSWEPSNLYWKVTHLSHRAPRAACLHWPANRI
jgi:hypothetical protein